jgi:hypothetical protein
VEILRVSAQWKEQYFSILRRMESEESINRIGDRFAVKIQ